MDLLQILRMRVEAVQAERGSLTNCYPTHISTGKFAPRNVGFDNVTGLKPHECLAPRSMAYQKAVCIGRTHLTRPMPGRFDPERLNLPDLNCLGSVLADTAARLLPTRLNRQFNARSV